MPAVGRCVGLALLAALPARAGAQCQLCTPDEAAAAAAKKPPARPISIEIETSFDYARIGILVVNQGGTAQIDPETGLRTLTGGLIDLGGLPVTGTVTVRGEPKEHVTVSFPANIGMTNAAGRTYPLSNFTTTLKNNPKIGDDGVLRFTFGGLLRIDGTATGMFRGSIPITIEYK
jgi:hypothetical protein